MTQTPFPLPQDNPAIRDFLKSRRSNLAKNMTGPGPSAEQLEEILSIAGRVPDHRKLAPWRFIIFEGEARQKIGDKLAVRFKELNPDFPDDRIDFEGERFLRAPTIIGVVSSPVECKRQTPEWEQRLSSAICCYNACLAAQSFGFGAQWLTEWYAYDEAILKELGLSQNERIAGFVYLGTPKDPSLPRPRPEIQDKISRFK